MRVERRAEAAALAAGAGQAEGGGSGVLLSGVLALPPAAAVVVECGEAEGGAEAVAAALEGEGLQAVPVPLEGAAFEWVMHDDDSGDHPIISTCRDHFQRMLDALDDADARPAAAPLPSSMVPTLALDGYLASTALAWALRQVVSEAWEAATPGVEFSQRLEWVFEVRDMLAELPAFVEAA
ncbi:hypothetical protein HYH03_005538 [Edaphochlamys debaryana]|uniref:Uncharacterized protein n=1 Tax=Edaphochlamys debaryana TaxID=47281 RepID=A0A835Y544_9CHLO|nr:hypothetical protein HYH03_005538 [Edaphochlamys debaryana]|eukprot:KAG2496305.1 hypothetical protein HYH03_005538 [Edaphochlamys debaryana]